jgi:hypothetical protein
MEVKYLLPNFDNDSISKLPPLFISVPSAYNCNMDGINKLYNGHVWCMKKMTKNYRLLF